MKRFSRCFRLITLISCVFLMANKPNDYDTAKLKNLLVKCFPSQTTGKDYKIFILADSKISCPACNKSFIGFLNEYIINKPNCFIINYSSGAMYDISDLLDARNCYNDRKTKLFASEGYRFEKSEVIIVKNNKIDTVMFLEPETMRETLQYINK